MVNTYIDYRLSRWAIWVLRSVDHGIGFPKQVSYISMMPRTGQSTNSPEFEQDAYDIDRCVLAVKVVNKQLHQVLDLAYLRYMTEEQKLKAANCCKKTFYNRLNRAQQLVLGYLNDIHAGCAIPEPSINSNRAA